MEPPIKVYNRPEPNFIRRGTCESRHPQNFANLALLKGISLTSITRGVRFSTHLPDICIIHLGTYNTEVSKSIVYDVKTFNYNMD